MKSFKVLLAILIISLLAVVFSACNKEYVPKYSLEDCDFTATGNASDFALYKKEYDADNFTVYFSKDIDVQHTDEMIDNLIEVNDLFSAHTENRFSEFYVNADFPVSFVSNEEYSLYVSAELTKEELLSWMIYYNNSERAPYGICAGLAEVWLKAQSLSSPKLVDIENLEEKYYLDLQYPLYEFDSEDRIYAFNVAYSLVSRMLENFSEEELLALGFNQTYNYIYLELGYSVPDFYFYPSTSKYEYKIVNENMTIYFDKDFEDLILPSEYFKVDYKNIRDWLLESQSTIDKVNNDYEINSIKPFEMSVCSNIDGAIGGITFLESREITLHSVGAFVHEYIHLVLHDTNNRGNFDEVFCELYRKEYRYARAKDYFLFSNQAVNYRYEIEESEQYYATWNKYAAEVDYTIDIDTFDVDKFADCFSYLYNEKDVPFINRLQQYSWVKYLIKNYGITEVIAAGKDTNYLLGGKTRLEVRYEWMDLLFISYN